MCGIVGFYSREPILDRSILVRMRDTMIHRGPDDMGEWWSADGHLGLAHRRLSIIDLSPGGHQPMIDYCGRYVITYNGEIYNYQDLRHELKSMGHQFRTESDTEVLLEAYRAWGFECVSRLNGMFVFCIFDIQQQKLFLARDRAGEKPLFYYFSQNSFYFASELKALMANPSLLRNIDPHSLDCFLAMGYVPGDRCILEGYNKLSPAHVLCFDIRSGTARVWRYWKAPDVVPKSEAIQVDESSLLDELDFLLEDSVRRQLVADVPVGVLLSGGVDSSLVTAMAVRVSNKVKTFTVGFQGFSNYDESGHARLIARHFRTDHMELEAGRVDPDLVLMLARQYDEPIIDSSMIPTFLVSQLVRQYCTVALGGDGGDELFGGYAHYNRFLWTQQKVGWIPLFLREIVARSIGDKLPTGFKGRNWLMALRYNLNYELPLIGAYFNDKERKELMGDQTRSPWSIIAEEIIRNRLPLNENVIQRATRMDFENYMPEDILVKVDRASMLNSLELRSPLLDYRIIEFAFSRVPTHLKTTSSQRKILLKKLSARVLPSKFDMQRKQGFSIPLSTWLKVGPWRDLFYDVLLDEKCVFNKKAVSSLMHGQEQGRSNSERIFGLVLFELWRREYAITI